MKLATLFTLLVSFNVFAAAEYAPVEIKWNERHLDEVVVLMCDDSYYAGVDLTIKGDYSVGGKIRPELYMAFKDCGADWKIVKRELVKKGEEVFTKVRLKGGSTCTMEIKEVEAPRSERKTFVLEIGDAC